MMSTLQLPDSLIEDYVIRFLQLEPQVQTVLLNRLAESVKENNTLPKNFPEKVFLYERVADPTGVDAARQLFGAWSGEENREDVEQMLRAIAENRMLDREVIL